MTRPITVEDLYRFTFLSSPRISPDGQRVAYVATTIDGQKHAYRSSLWMIPTRGGEARRFTLGSANAHGPDWSPDGRWLAFVSEREGEEPGASAGNDEQEQRLRGKGKAQIWLIPTDGGEARQLTSMPHGASSPTWSPDSQHLLFSAAVGPIDEVDADGKPLPKARVIDRLFYRLDGVGFVYERRQHLFLLNVVEGSEPLQLTAGDWDDGDAAWSPDGKSIAFTSNRAEDRWRFLTPDLYTLAIAEGKAGELRRLTSASLSCASPSWSPDGRTLAFFAGPRQRSGGHLDLYTIDAVEEQAEPLCLTREFEGSGSDSTNSDTTDEHMVPAPAWSADGRTLYTLQTHRGSTRIFAIPASGAGAHPTALAPEKVHVLDFSIDQSKDTLAVLSEDPTHLGEIFVCSPAVPAEWRQITASNAELLSELDLVRPEYMPYTGADGWPMDGWIMRPRAFEPGRKYPLIVEIHGGPNTEYGYGFFHEMQLLAAAGNVVLYTNPRGSTGYGRDFALAVRGAWGIKDALDILAGVDAVVQKGYIDEQRLGVIGGSYGGFMTNWLIGHHDRFKAAVTDRSVTDRSSFFGSSDVGWDFADDDMETTPWEDPELYRRMSPLTYVKDMHTPLLIIHSEQDLRCNIEQAEQLFASLKYMGREVLFVRFEGQSHGLSRGGHPRLRKARLQHILGWFERYL
jgi:dipeptidyl aminopeptidase/acylaminoacyl peptidase